MKTKHTRRSGIKSSASRWYVLLALMGFLTILLWPSMTAAVPLTLTDAEQLKQAWEYAADVGVYRYQTDVLQTTHPTEKLVNVGRSSKIDRFSVVGMMDRPNDTMQMRIQADGTIELKVVEGVSYGRVNSQDEWTQVENQSDFFAPGGDPLGYLNAAENIQEAKDMGQDAGSGEPDLETALANPHSVLGTAYSVYTFDLNGPKYARFMRDQMEEHLRRTGELPLNMNLELARTYIDMQGCGEIWIDAEANLPVRQVIHLEFPPERGALEWVSANITTNFFEWEELTSGNQGAASLTRLWENPTVLSTQVVKSLASANIRQFAFTLGLSLSVLGLVALSITYCRSPKFYAAISLSVIFSMVSTPLMQSNQVYAFYEQQQAKQVEYEQQVEQQNEQAAIEAELAGRNFDPQVNPLANSPALLVPDFSRQSAITITATYTTGHDTDSDGLTDEVELLELGTSPEYVDSDGDGISDISEVTGFNNGTQWYLNPLDIDSNGDGLADLAECPDLGDVDENEELISPSGSRCQDIDNDGTPDVFDFDNDGDGVPDAVDSTPNHTGRPSTTSQGELTLNLNNYQNERTLLVDFELRPVDDSHLWYIYNVLDWPDDDTSGQIMRTTDDNLTDDGDIMLSPVLEIVLPYSDANPSRGLPISASVTITANTPIANWLDQGKLDEYSISVTQDDDGTLYAYVPLVVIQDVVGDSPAAWGARMLYTMDSGSTGWGEDHTIKLLWMVTAVTDTCDTSAMSDSDDYDDYCAADSGHWVSANSVIQTYYEDFYLTSLYVKQEHGMQAAVIAQNDALSVPYEDSLWHLADGLQDAFLAPELVGGSTRFDIAEIETRFDDDSPTYADGAPERWDIPKSALDVTAVYTYPDQTSGLNDMINSLIPGVLDTAYAAATADDRVTLLFAREESYKSTTLGDSEVTVGYGSLSVDLGALDEKTLAGLNWAAYVYDGLGWDSDDVDDYLDYFELQLDSVIDLNSLLGGEVVSDEDMARAGAISLAQNYYLAFYQGISGLVEIGGDPTDSTGLDDGDYGLDGQTTENLIIGNLLSLLQTVFDEEDAIIMDGQELSDAALTTFFSEGELAVALGELDNGALTLKARKLGKNLAATLYKKLYKKIHDIHGTKTTAGKWAKRGATGITLLNAGIVGYLYLSGSIDAETASTIIYSSASVSSSLSLFASYSTLKKLRRAEFLSDIKGIQKYTQVGAVAGAALEIGIAVGMMVYTVLSQGIEFGSPEFYGLLAQTIAQVIIAIVYAVIAATVVGSIIIAFITLIDALLGALCATDVIDAEEGDAVDTWVCGGITGALTVILTYVILDYTPLVDLEREDRLDVVLNDPTLTQITEASGYVEGNQIAFSGNVTSSLYMNSPNWMGYYYPWQLDDDYLEESSFEYRFQQSESDVGIGLNKTDWDVPAGREPETAWDPIPNGARFYKNFDVNKAYTFGDAGINQNLSMYLSEGFTMNAQNCWLLPTLPPTPVCYLQDFQDTFHTDMSEDMQFDILPNTVGGFRELTLVENDSYRLAWDSQFPTLADADNDGLRSKEMGGPDPNDSNPDTDGDGLSDYWEYANGFDLQDEDADQDGLTDYWEAFYDSDPNQSDSDNDGLSDYHEVFHPNKVYPYENSVFSNDNPPPWAQDASAWAGGWDIVYEFTSSGQPLSFWVSADPNDADADGDSITDSREKIYGYNPNVATELKVLSLDSAIETSSGHTPYVAPGGQISYTATISNELDNRYARGLLQIEFPRDTVQSTQIIETLDPLAVVDMSGQIDVDAAITTSFATSATVRAGAIIDQGTGRMLWLRMNETSGSVLADSSMQGHDATCGPCPTLTGQYLIFSNSGEIVTVDTANDDFERNSFSVGAWVYPTLFFNSVILQDGSHYDLSLSNGLVPSARVYLSGGQQVEAQNTGESLTLGVWNHVMFTFSFIEETQTAEITLYLNGEAVDSDSHTGESLRSSPTSLQLGAGLFGYLDEVEFYASTLNDNEVRALVAVPILDIDFATMSDQSDSGASVGCSGDFCPTTSVDTASFDQLDYLTVSDPELDLSGGPFSFAGWIKPKSRSHAFDGSARSTFSDYLPDTSRDWQGVFGITDWDQDDHYPSLYLSSSGHVWVTFKNDGVTCEYKSSSGLVDNGVWQHLVVAFDGTGFSIFVNGKEVDSSGAVCSIAPPSLTTFTVGRPNSHSYFYFNQLEMTSWDDGLDFCEEVRLNYDGSQKWSKDVCDPNPYTSPDTVYKSIDKGYLFDDLGNHSFKLWEEDSWPNGDDTYLNETINYADLFDGNTAYDDGGSEGNLYWSLSNDYFRGELQTFKLYNYGLPAASVADLFSSNATALEMPFDEAPGQHTLADTSGNGFFATCSQATGSCPDSGIPGRSNQALRFDGGVADDDGYDGVADYATVEATTDLLGLYDTSFSVLAWIKADDLSGDRSILGTPTRSINEGLHLIIRDAQPYMGFFSNDTAGATTLETERWYHLAWVYDKDSSTQSIYVNGVL
ncbi:MAG: LamG domain-containing protein, partial [Chloroflexi bacterium]|nr:LamG domain-containing protein [Chloroflexota bacterium]